MRTLSKFEKTVPNFVKSFLSSINSIELCQIVEFPEHFLIMTYDKFEDEYRVGRVEKRTSDDQDECDLIDGHAELITQEDYQEYQDNSDEDYYSINSFEDYASYRFALELGIEGI